MARDTRGMPILYIKHRGMFNHSQLVKGIQKWFEDNNYVFHAGKFKLKPNEAEYEISGELKVNEYVQYTIEVHMWIRDMSEVEVVEDGEKKKMQEGMINAETTGKYTLDYNARFGGSKFMQWLQDFYHKYVIRQTIDDVGDDDMFLKVVMLNAHIKGLLGIEAG